MDRKAMSPARVAAEIGKSVKTVERALVGDTSVKASTLTDIATALGLDEAEVLPARSAAEQAQLDRIEQRLENIERLLLDPTQAGVKNLRALTARAVALADAAEDGQPGRQSRGTAGAKPESESAPTPKKRRSAPGADG